MVTFIASAKQTASSVWKFKAEGGFSKNYKERSGFWASPIVVKDRIYIGSNNGFMYCLSADKGEVVWQQLVRAPIWGTSPVVDGRVVFGDKAGWIYMLSAKDGRTLARTENRRQHQRHSGGPGRADLYRRLQRKALFVWASNQMAAGSRWNSEVTDRLADLSRRQHASTVRAQARASCERCWAACAKVSRYSPSLTTLFPSSASSR